MLPTEPSDGFTNVITFTRCSGGKGGREEEEGGERIDKVEERKEGESERMKKWWLSW